MHLIVDFSTVEKLLKYIILWNINNMCCSQSKNGCYTALKHMVPLISFQVAQLTQGFYFLWAYVSIRLFKYFVEIAFLSVNLIVHVYHHSSVVWGIGLVNHRSCVQIRQRLLLRFTEIIFVKSYFHQKLHYISFCDIHIYYMLPHLSLSKYFVLYRETLSSCIAPHSQYHNTELSITCTILNSILSTI